MKAECVDAKDAPEGYYAVVGNYTLGCSGVCCEQHRVDGCDVIFKKIPANVSPSSTKKLVIHSNGGSVLLCFDGFDLPRISILNYGDISAQEVAERLLACWNKHIHESVGAIEGGNDGKSK